MGDGFDGPRIPRIEISHGPADKPDAAGGGPKAPDNTGAAPQAVPAADANAKSLDSGQKPSHLGGRKGKGGKKGAFMEGKVRKEGKGKGKEKTPRKPKPQREFKGPASEGRGLTIKQQKRLDKALGRGFRRKTEKSTSGMESPGGTVQQLPPADAALLSYRAIHTQLLNKGVRSEILQRIQNSYGETPFQDVEKLGALLASVGGDKPSQIKEITDRLRAVITARLTSPKGQGLLFWRRDSAPLPKEDQEQIIELWIYLKMTGIIGDGRPVTEHKQLNVMGAQIEHTLKTLKMHSGQQKLAQEAVTELTRVNEKLTADKKAADGSPEKLTPDARKNFAMRKGELDSIIKKARQAVPRTLMTFVTDMPLFKNDKLTSDELMKIATNETTYPALPFETRHPPEKKKPTPEEVAARAKEKAERRKGRRQEKKAEVVAAGAQERQRELEVKIQTFDMHIQEARNQRVILKTGLKALIESSIPAETKASAQRLAQDVLDKYSHVLDLAKKKADPETDIDKRTYRSAQQIIQEGGAHGTQSFNDKFRLAEARILAAREALKKVTG